MDSMPLLLRFHLKFFQFLGYCPISLHCCKTSSLQQILTLIWPIILLSIFSILTSFVFFSDEEFRHINHAFGFFNDTLKFSLAQISITANYVETLYRRRAQWRFWECFSLLQKGKFMEIYPNSFQRMLKEIRQQSHYLFIVFGVTLLEIIFLFIFIIAQEKNRHLYVYWWTFAPFVWFIHFRNMQFILYLELIRQELVQLRFDLALLADYTRFTTRVRSFNGFDEFLCEKILQKQKVYQVIYEMYECFQKAFGYSIMFTLLMFYGRVLADLYFVYYSLHRNINRYENLMIIPCMFEIPAYLLTSKNCMDVIKFITFEIHSIIRPINDMNLSKQIQNFSLMLLHQKVIINGVGIATMNGYLLTRIVGSITMYMIFFIQFMPKFGQL